MFPFQCLGQTGTVVGIDEDHDIVVSYPSGNRLVETHLCPSIQSMRGISFYSPLVHQSIPLTLRFLVKGVFSEVYVRSL